MKINFSSALPVLLLLLHTASAVAVQPSRDEIVDLQLRWHHQFQFAGYYAALEKGYYRDEGLEVRLHTGDPAHQPVQEVLSGHAQYAEGNSEVLHQRLLGQPLIALAAIFQHSPSVLLTRQDSGIRSVHDLAGKKVMLMNRTDDADFLVMFLNEGIPLSQIQIIPSSYRLEDLLDGKVDAFNAYSTNEPYFLSKRGIPCHVIEPGSYGIDFYSDILFTTETELQSHPERVRKMLRATLKGWEYAMAHPEEIIDLLVDRYHVDKSRDHLQYEAAEMRKRILPDLIEIGHMNAGRWQQMADAFVKAGLVDSKEHFEGFIYNAEPEQLPGWVIPALLTAVFVIVIILTAVNVLMLLNRRLKSARQQLHDSNLALSEEIEERKSVESSLRISEARYHSLFDNMLEGFAFCRMVYRDGKPEDFVYLEVNPAFEALTGLTAVAGRKATEVIPTIKQTNPELFDIYGRVAAGGTAEKFELFIESIHQWFSVSACYADHECFVTMLENITDRKLLQQKYENMAQTDYLTGLPNRRHFMHRAEAELSRALRYSTALSLLMLDLDNFKQINDSYGHKTGDKALQAFSTLCQSVLREADLIGRLGGEEFVIMLPETGPADALEVAERLRLMTSETYVLLEDDRPLYFTVSIGVATVTERCGDIDALLQQADQALYQAKARGRNRVHTAAPIDPDGSSPL